MGGDEDVFVEAPGCANVDEPSAHRWLADLELEVTLRQHDRLRSFALEDVEQVGRGLADHKDRFRLGDACLFASDVTSPVALAVGVVPADVREYGNVGVDDVRGIEPAKHANLDDGNVHGDLGEPSVGHRGEQLKVAVGLLRDLAELFQVGDLIGEVFPADWLAIDLDAFRDGAEVRAAVPADLQALGLQQAGDHGGGGALAVGSGHVNGPVGEVRVAREPHEGFHGVQGQVLEVPGAGFQVDVLVKEAKRLSEVHPESLRPPFPQRCLAP